MDTDEHKEGGKQAQNRIKLDYYAEHNTLAHAVGLFRHKVNRADCNAPLIDCGEQTAKTDWKAGNREQKALVNIHSDCRAIQDAHPQNFDKPDNKSVKSLRTRNDLHNQNF